MGTYGKSSAHEGSARHVWLPKGNMSLNSCRLSKIGDVEGLHFFPILKVWRGIYIYCNNNNNMVYIYICRHRSDTLYTVCWHHIKVMLIVARLAVQLGHRDRASKDAAWSLRIWRHITNNSPIILVLKRFKKYQHTIFLRVYLEV